MDSSWRPTSFLPSIKCSGCGHDIEISRMGDHICAPAREESRPLNPRPPDTWHHIEIPSAVTSPPTQSSRGGFSKSGRIVPPPRIDMGAANDNPYRHNTDNYLSTSNTGQYSDRSPSSGFQSPLRSATSPLPRPFNPPPSPEISNLDCAFPPFPARSGKSTPTEPRYPRDSPRAEYDNFNDLRQQPQQGPLSPRPNIGGNMLQKMNSIAPGPFSARRPQTPEETPNPSPGFPGYGDQRDYNDKRAENTMRQEYKNPPNVSPAKRHVQRPPASELEPFHSSAPSSRAPREERDALNIVYPIEEPRARPARNDTRPVHGGYMQRHLPGEDDSLANLATQDMRPLPSERQDEPRYDSSYPPRKQSRQDSRDAIGTESRDKGRSDSRGRLESSERYGLRTESPDDFQYAARDERRNESRSGRRTDSPSERRREDRDESQSRSRHDFRSGDRVERRNRSQDHDPYNIPARSRGDSQNESRNISRAEYKNRTRSDSQGEIPAIRSNYGSRIRSESRPEATFDEPEGVRSGSRPDGRPDAQHDEEAPRPQPTAPLPKRPSERPSDAQPRRPKRPTNPDGGPAAPKAFTAFTMDVAAIEKKAASRARANYDESQSKRSQPVVVKEKVADQKSTRSPRLVADFTDRDPYHTPTESQSSNGSGYVSDSKTGSSRSTPPLPEDSPGSSRRKPKTPQSDFSSDGRLYTSPDMHADAFGGGERHPRSNYEKSTYERSSPEKPAHGRSMANKPVYDQPTSDEPRHEQPEPKMPTYERAKTEKPSQDQLMHEKPTFERSKSDKPSYERAKPEKPSRDQSTTEKPSHERSNKDKPSYGKSKKPSDELPALPSQRSPRPDLPELPPKQFPIAAERDLPMKPRPEAIPPAPKIKRKEVSSMDRPMTPPNRAASPSMNVDVQGPPTPPKDPRPFSPTPQKLAVSPEKPRLAPLQKRPTIANRGNCRGCSEQIIGKSVSSADGRLTGRYHKQCFVCRTCSQPFETATFYVLDNFPYCERHYHVLNESLCQSCDHGIEGEYLETEVKQKFHANCFCCQDCRKVLQDDYFEMNGKVYCEPHAMRRAQQNTFLGAGRKNPERRTTRLMMMQTMI